MFFRFELRALDEWMGLQEFTKTLSQGTGAVAVNDADLGSICQGCFIQEFVDALASLLDGHADHVDLACCATFAGLCAYRDVFPLRRLHRSLPRRRAFDSRDLFHG